MLSYINGHVWRKAAGLQISPVTLTQFLKMQLPVEPTSLSAETEEMEKGRVKERKKEEGGEEGAKLDWMVLSAHSMAQTQRNLNSYSCEEEETKKSE